MEVMRWLRKRYSVWTRVSVPLLEGHLMAVRVLGHRRGMLIACLLLLLLLLLLTLHLLKLGMFF